MVRSGTKECSPSGAARFLLSLTGERPCTLFLVSESVAGISPMMHRRGHLLAQHACCSCCRAGGRAASLAAPPQQLLQGGQQQHQRLHRKPSILSARRRQGCPVDARGHAMYSSSAITSGTMHWWHSCDPAVCALLLEDVGLSQYVMPSKRLPQNLMWVSGREPHLAWVCSWSRVACPAFSSGRASPPPPPLMPAPLLPPRPALRLLPLPRLHVRPWRQRRPAQVGPCCRAGGRACASAPTPQRPPAATAYVPLQNRGKLG